MVNPTPERELRDRLRDVLLADREPTEQGLTGTAVRDAMRAVQAAVIVAATSATAGSPSTRGHHGL